MAGAAPFAGGPAGSTAGRGGRLLGVDLARLLALLGMFATHLIVPVPGDGPGGVDGLFQLAAGRSSALFALLAGVSLAIVTRGAPGGGAARGQSRSGGVGDTATGRVTVGVHRRRLLVRAAAIAVIGLALGLLNSGVAVILVYYAVLFCCALPVLTWRAPALAALAVGWGLLSPVVSVLVRPALPATTYQVPSVFSLLDPAALLSELLVTGYYPVLTWATYLFAGLAVGRLLAPGGATLADAGVPLRLGAGLTLVGLGLATTSLVVSGALTGRGEVRGSLVDSSGSGNWEQLALEMRRGFYRVHPEDSAWWLGMWVPHSGSVVDLAHTTGTALLVLGLAWGAVRLVPQLPWRLLAGAGAMTLTLYTLHVAVLGSPLGDTGRALARGSEHALVLHASLALVGGAVLAALRRPGPLEQGVRRLTALVGSGR